MARLRATDRRLAIVDEQRPRGAYGISGERAAPLPIRIIRRLVHAMLVFDTAKEKFCAEVAMIAVTKLVW